MVSQDNFGSKNTSDNNGGLLPPSLLESASLDDNSDLIELRKSFRFTNSSDPFAKLTEPQNKSDISVPTSKTAKSSSVSLTNPVNLISSDESSSKNNPGQNLLVPIQSKTTKVDSTNKDLLTGEKNNTQLVGATAFDPLLGTVNNSLSTLSLLPDVLPPTLSATILPLDLLPGSPQARLVGIVNGTGSAIASLTVQFDNLAAGPISVSPLGTFDKVLDFAGLNSGTHTLTVKATDIAGNASVASFSLTLNLSDTPPAILAALARDTAPSGTTNTDTITFDPTTTGTVRVSNRGLFINALTESTPIVTAVANVSITETNYITSLKAGFDNIAVENYANVLADLRSDGSFTFNRTRLDAIYGGSLPDGHHTLHLKAIDKYGVTSKYDISFTLDTTTAVPILNLSPSSDSGVSNSDHITLDTTPTIVGTAEALATVKLFNNGQLKGQTTATTDGTWQITTSELTDGMYQLNAIATDIAGNTSTSANLEVTIDSALPQVNLTTPVGQFDLRLGDKLTGSVDGTGSAVTALSYRFNNLQDVSLDFDTNGNFDQVLDFTGLDNGEHTLTITATDTAGNIKTIQSTLRVIIDEQAPVIIASLLRDTAAFQQTNSDKITYDSTIIGTVKDASRVVEFKAGFDNTTVANFISVLPQRNIDGSFNFGRTQLETIYGGTLPDGIHTLHLQALDEYGNNSDIFDLTFVLDTNVLTPIFDLSPASDSPEVGDKKTVAETITLVGQTDAYATVVLEETNITTTASDTGKFSFDNVLLARGQNSFTARAIDIAGNENTFFTNIYRFSPPTGIALMGNTVAENSIAGTVIGQLDTTDPDIGDSFTYTLVDDALGRFQIVGNELQVANSNLLDFESNQQYSITVCSQDASGLSKTETFTILVTNVNEAPSFVSNPVLNAEVNNLYTYNIVTIDPDAGDTHTITVNGLPSELSFTDNGDGTASISGTPNRLPDGKYNITLTVTDAGGLTATQAFELSPQVNLVEETNFAVSRSLSFTIPTVPSILSFKIDPQFDNADLDSINDAFEVALIDANGNSLVHTVANGRDAFFNWTEGEAITLGAGASYNTSDRIISLNLVGITPGTNARLVFRLVNNDSDIATNVRITDFEILDAPFGTQPPLGSSFVTQGTLQVVPNFNLLADVSQSFVAQYHSTSFNADTHLLYANIAIQNIGSYSVDAPLIVAVDRISNPNVFVRNPDGFTPDGIPYYDFTKLVGDKKLDPNELTQERSLIFYNPEQVQFTYNLTVLSELNAAPVIQTQANKEIIAGYNYSYDVDATDPNGDSLQYKLLVSPDGMTIDPSTGLISWNTTGTNVSNQTVLIEVSDGRGGVTKQQYTLSVIDAPPNRPPIFTSTPVVDAAINTSYTYQAVAKDPDFDSLTYSLLNAPAGMTIDRSTGQISWIPTTTSLKAQPVTYFGEDLNFTNNDGVRLVNTPYSNAARDEFFSRLIAPVTENFEGFANGASPTTLRFGTDSATVSGSVSVKSIAQGTTYNGVFPASGDKTLFMFGSTPPSLQLNFNTPQAAIGFYVTDIGDGGGQLNLTLANGATKQIQIPHKIDNNISGSKFYFGYIDVANPFTKVTFSASTSNDGYGIDDITVARVEQVKLLTDVPVIVRTTDGRGGIADQNFKIHVQPEPGNYAPMIITDPVTQTYNSVSYTYNLKALDPDNDSLTYSLVKAPNGMTIDANTGMISWSTPVVGQQDVTVRVQDSRGGLDTQSFKLDVSGIAPGQIRGKVYTNDPLLAETNIPITAITTADNHFLLYYGKADGSGLTYVGRGDRWESVHSFNLNLKPDDYLYIVAWNDPDATPRMWLGEFNLPNGVTLLSNDSDWQVMVGSGRNPNFTQSSPLLTTVEQDISRQTWSVPQQAAPNVGGQVWGQKQGISSSAEFLWYDSFYATTPTDANYLIFRSTTPVGTYFVNQYKQGLAGQTVYLDTNQNHKRDLDEPYTLTDEQGNYSFAVSPNTYSLAGDLASEWNQISPAIDTYELTVATGEIVSGYDFVYTKSKPHPTFDNSSPIFTNEPITTVEAGKKLLYRADATDPEGDTLIYELLVKPDGMIVDPVTGFLSWRPTLDQVGVQDVVLRVKDNYGGVALQSFQVEVTPPVYPPTFTTSISDFATFHPVIGQLFEYQFKAVDPEGYSVTYQLDTAETTAFIDPDTGLFSWTPTTLRSNLTPNGAFQFGLSAIDEQGKKSTFLFELLPQASQSSSNSFPTIISSPRKSIALGQSYVYIVQASDPDFDALTYSLEAAPDGMSIDQQGRITWQPKTTQLGSNPVSIKISDGRGGVVTQAFDIDVVSTTYRANNAPSIVSTPNLVTNLERIYAYNLAGSDSDGDLLLWSLDSSPAGMVIDPQSGALRWQPQADQIGKHTVVVRLTDAYGLYVAQEFTLTVNGVNTPPQIASTPVTRAAKNQAYTYTVVATDPENDQLTFALGKKPAGMTIDENGTIRWTPQVSQVGQQEVEVLVTDAQGAVTSQTYKIEVSEAAINRAPTIVSTPVYIANVGSAYQYQVRATDQDTGDRLTYQLLSVPAGVNGISIDSTTGLLTWANPVAGNYKIVVGAVDAGGLGAAQGFTLTARANNAPVIRSTPVLTATPGSAYAYDLIASDVDGDRLTYTLDQASLNKGITLDALGRLRWNPAVSNVGTHRIVLTVSDGITSTPQQYDLVVAADTEAPKVRLIANYDTVDLGQTIIFQARATDNVKVAGLRLSIDDTPVVLDANGMARFTPTVAGTIIAKAIATDTAGNPSQEVTFSVLVRDPNDVDAPDVSFHLSGITNGFVTAPTKINANISDPDGNLDYYRLLVAPVSGGEFKELWRNDNPANSVNGELPDQYKFDPSLLQNDSYIVRLEVGDNGGNISYSEEVVDVAGELKLGNFRLSFTDLTVPVTGVPITLTRTYDSLNSGSTDDFGYGWRMEFRDTDLRTSLKRDPDMEELGYHSAFKEGTRVYITLPGGKREAFTFKPKMVQKYEGVYLGQFAQYFYQPEFVADKGGTSTLTVESNFITKGQGTDQFFGFAGNAYNPEDPYFGGKYKLTTKEGVVYEIDAATGDLLTVTDTNGNKLTYTDAGIYSSTGKQVTFERDAQGRIAAVKDPMGELIRYTYDAKGDLISVKDQEQFETKFVYDTTQPHYLKEIIDPLNRTGAKVEYGDDGRLKKTLNATGNSVEIDYDPANSLQTVKDVLGNSTTYEYDTRGNVVRVVDALGNQTRMVYDDNNNLLQVTDANNLVTKYEYDDKSNLKSRTEQYCGCATVTPGTSYYTYDKFGNMETLVTPTGASMIMKYDSYGQMLSMKDGKGNLIQSFSYYANGLVRSETDSTGTTIYEYDDFGNLIQTTDPDGSITIMEYYADGKLRRMVEDHGTPNDTSDDEIFTFEYDKLGREKFVDYGDGIWVKYDYEGAGGDWTKLEAPTIGKIERKFTPNGKLAGWITADGGTPMYKYDAAGRLFRETDASGNDVTEYSYDAAGRVTSVKDLQTGATTSKKYDAGGRVIEEVDTLKVFTRYNYNTRTGRLDSTQSGKYLVNASGNLILDANNNPIVDTTVEIRTYRYEYNGLQTTVIDPLERRTTTVSDDYYLPKETIYQLRDGSKFSEKTEYLYASNLQEAKDYPTRVVDIGGNDRVFEYDELGRLKSATDLGNSKYIYDYGDNGLAKITSPTGETLQYGYDALGNLAKVTYGDNTFKQMTYNTVDNRLETVTLPSGETITYDYDDAGRVRSQTSSTSGSVSFTYTAEGVVETMTDSTGTTTYRYDSNKRLEGIDSPNGSSISYTYDIVGRIKTLTEKGSATATAYTTEYDYDAFDNLSWIKDPAGGITTMKYDVVNRLQERTLPNGVKTTYEYDDLDRVKSIVHTNAQGQVLASVTYERQGIGEPSKIIREDGSYVKLEYDSALRVEQESYYNAAGQLLNEASYTYDASGKRQVQSTSTGERTFNYSTGYQLDTVTEAGETENYDYDANGRLTLIERDGKTLDLNHDAYDRLTSVENETTGQTTQYIYDGQGNRVKAIEGTQERRFLVAPAMGGGLQSTDLITDSSGNLISNYIYGGGSSPFMRLDANGNAVYYLTDAMGSVIGLADNSGASSGKFLYDAFGNTLSQVGGADADTGGDFRFQGQWLESESGLYHFRARDYDPATGLFLSRDPVNIIETVPESFNPYQFVYNNPYIYSDPTGMITINEIGIARQVENILRTIGEKAKNEGVKEAINKAKGTVTDIVQDFISDLIPVSDELQWLYDTVAGTGDVGKIGNPFEMLLIDVILCPILQSGGLANWLWREVPIDKSSGKAIDNGYQCGQEPSKMPRVRPGSTARPDFVISAFPPKETSPFGVSIVSKKAWLIGDLKASVEKAYSEVTSKSEDNQWDAIRNFARKYQYVPVSSYVTLFSDSKLANQAKKEALSQGVYLRFISILQDKNPS